MLLIEDKEGNRRLLPNYYQGEYYQDEVHKIIKHVKAPRELMRVAFSDRTIDGMIKRQQQFWSDARKEVELRAGLVKFLEELKGEE